MKINYIDYSIATKSLDIFFSGCRNKCEDCCNPELMDFDNGIDYVQMLPKIKSYLDDYGTLIENVFLVGGSPNHQDSEDMATFLEGLHRRYKNKSIYMFCGEELSQVQPVFKKYCDFIKCGAYIPSLKCDDNYQYGIKLATANQKIYKKGEDY